MALNGAIKWSQPKLQEHKDSDGDAVIKSTCRSRRLGYNRIGDSLSPRPCLWQSSGAGPQKTEGPRTDWAPGANTHIERIDSKETETP